MARPTLGSMIPRDYAVPYIGVKAGIGDDVDCMADYSEPSARTPIRALNWAGANNEYRDQDQNATTTRATCSYKFDVGPGQFRLIGGGFYQEVERFQGAPGHRSSACRLPPSMTASVVWISMVQRLGLARRRCLRNSGIRLPRQPRLQQPGQVRQSQRNGRSDRGSASARPCVRSARGTDVSGSARCPDSLELKLQTGIAPDWLAFGSVKWTNWSQSAGRSRFCPTSTRGIPPAGCRPTQPRSALSRRLDDHRRRRSQVQ